MGAGILHMRTRLLLIHGSEMIIIETVMQEGTVHRSPIRRVRVHLGHLIRVTHRDPSARVLVLEEVHTISALDAILSVNFQVEQLVRVNSGVAAEVEALGSKVVWHKSTVVHG